MQISLQDYPCKDIATVAQISGWKKVMGLYQGAYSKKKTDLKGKQNSEHTAINRRIRKQNTHNKQEIKTAEHTQ